MVALPDQKTLKATGIDTDAISKLAGTASTVGFEVVDLAAFFDQVEAISRAQLDSLEAAKSGASRINEANAGVFEAVETVAKTALGTLETVEASNEKISASLEMTREMANWVNGIEARIGELDATLQMIIKSNQQITGIAKQVNILAINATIEAARAGDMGRGFAVVADAINELSRETARAAEGIGDNIASLGVWTRTMLSDANDMSKQTTSLIDASDSTAASLTSIADSSRATHDNASGIAERARAVAEATSDFAPSFARIGDSATQVAQGITQAHVRLETMIDSCEGIVQYTTRLGAETPDTPMIQYVQRQARRISHLFEEALRTGQITNADLFDTKLQPIPNTNPKQYLARFTALTDRLLPPILEEALSFDKRVVFSAAVNTQGYLPTHNKKFSAKPSSDPEWNSGNCRNRRLFNDRVGLKAGQNTQDFLLQVYRRDMGKGQFIMMKDLAAPISVNGRHWGGLRMGYGL